MTQFRFEAEAAVSFDVEAAFEWYEAENSGLGFEFLEQLRRSYLRILENPLAYQELRHGIRRALTRQFPYAIYFSIEGETILILAVLHVLATPQSGKSAFRGIQHLQSTGPVLPSSLVHPPPR